MKRLFFLLSFLLFGSGSFAGGDLPFPLDEVQVMSAPEVWRDPLNEYKVLCQEGHAQGIQVLIIRILSSEGHLLDQKVVEDLPGGVETVFVWPEGDLKFSRASAGQSASLQGSGNEPRALYKASVMIR